MYAPDAAVNLLSTRKIVQKGNKGIVNQSGAKIIDKTNQVVATEFEENGIYQLINVKEGKAQIKEDKREVQKMGNKIIIILKKFLNIVRYVHWEGSSNDSNHEDIQDEIEDLEYIGPVLTRSGR